jgi:hypothetical protein
VLLLLCCRDAWKAHAAQQGGRGSYLRFANMLINDSIYLLDESLKYVKVGGHCSMQLCVHNHECPCWP